jgi:hypothetical protein
MTNFAARREVALAAAALLAAASVGGCVGADPADGEEPIDCVGGRCDSFGDGVVPGCAAVTLDGVRTPVFQAADGSNVFFSMPDAWVLEEGMRASYWLASSFQYFSTDEVALFEQYSMAFSLRLDTSETEEELLAALRARYPGATLRAMPLSGFALDDLQLALPAPESLVALETTLETQSLRVRVDADLTREGVEALTVFFGNEAGILRVSAALTYSCDQGLGLESHTAYPQAGGPGVAVEAASITFDDATGTLAGAADQIMLSWTAILPVNWEQVTYMADHAAELEALVRPLLRYDGSTPTPADVRAIGASASTLVIGAETALRAAGMTDAEIESRFWGIRLKVQYLSEFQSDTRVYAL